MRPDSTAHEATPRRYFVFWNVSSAIRLYSGRRRIKKKEKSGQCNSNIKLHQRMDWEEIRSVTTANPISQGWSRVCVLRLGIEISEIFQSVCEQESCECRANSTKSTVQIRRFPTVGRRTFPVTNLSIKSFCDIPYFGSTFLLICWDKVTINHAESGLEICLNAADPLSKHVQSKANRIASVSCAMGYT